MVIDSVASGVGASAASVFDIPSVWSRSAAAAFGGGDRLRCRRGDDRRPVWG